MATKVKEKEKKSQDLGSWLQNAWDTISQAYVETEARKAGGQELVDAVKQERAAKTAAAAQPANRSHTGAEKSSAPKAERSGTTAKTARQGTKPREQSAKKASAPAKRQGAKPSEQNTKAGTKASASVPAARRSSKYTSGVLDLADDRTSSLYSGTYADILRRRDYDALSQAGESKSAWFKPFSSDGLYDYINDINGSREEMEYSLRDSSSAVKDWVKYSLLTDNEIGVYNYLYATEGKQAANAFLEDLEPEINRQLYSAARRNNAQQATQNAATKALYSVATVAAAPARSITGALATAQDAWRLTHGQEIDPYSDLRQLNLMTADTRAAVSEDMSSTGRFLYNAAMSAGDSAMNQLTTSGMLQGLGMSGNALSKATATLSSLAMSSEVTANAVAEYKEKGYSDLFALSRALIRGGIEYGSEKIGGEWVIGNIKANPYNFLKSAVLNAIPEGTEEIMSDAGNEAVDLFTDFVLGTDESYIRGTYDYYKQYGSKEQKENPWLWTALAILKNETVSFVGGAVSTFGTSGVYTLNYRSSVNRSARALNTTPAEVRQLMAEYNLEDPAKVEALAELGDLHSPEDFRTAMDQAAKAKDYAEEAGKSSAQQDDGQEGAQEKDAPAEGFAQEKENAPVAAEEEDQNRNAYEELQNRIDGLRALTSMRLESVPMGEREDFVLDLAKSLLKYQGHDAAMEYLATVTGSRQLSTDAGNRVYETLQREEEKALADEN